MIAIIALRYKTQLSLRKGENKSIKYKTNIGTKMSLGNMVGF